MKAKVMLSVSFLLVAALLITLSSSVSWAQALPAVPIRCANPDLEITCITSMTRAESKAKKGKSR